MDVSDWPKYERLAWWIAYRLAKRCRKDVWSKRYRNATSKDWIGSVTLVFLDCLRTFDPDKGFQFSSYFTRAAFRSAQRWQGLDSESQAAWHADKSVEYYNAYETHSLFFRAAPKGDDEVDKLLGLFECKEDLWRFVARRLSLRSRNIIEQRFVNGLTLAQIADDLKISKQRVSQLELKALEEIRKALTELDAWKKLFA